jgi:hypothetical protein
MILGIAVAVEDDVWIGDGKDVMWYGTERTLASEGPTTSTFSTCSS